jgi:hypothetical protein
MPIPVINYAALPPSGDMAARGMIPALQQGFQLGMSPFVAQQELEKNKLANALAKVNLQYAPQTAEAELAYKQAQTPYLQAQTNQTNLQSQYYPQDIMSQIALRGAQTNLTGEQAKYLPLDTLIQASNSMRSNTRFGNAYQLSKLLGAMPAAERAQWQSDHPEEYNELVNTMANQAYQQQAGQTDDLLTSAIGKYFPDMMPKQVAGQGKPSNAPQINDQSLAGKLSPFPNKFSSTPEQIEKLKTAANLEANKSVTTAATRRQLEGAIQVQEIINDPDFNKRAVDASNYAGMAGKGQAALDAFFKDHPEAFNNYLTFKNVDMVLMGNRIRTLDQMGATDAQREELEGMYKNTMDVFYSNPSQFMTQFNNLKKSLDNVARGVQKSAMPLGGQNRLNPQANQNNDPFGLRQ